MQDENTENKQEIRQLQNKISNMENMISSLNSKIKDQQIEIASLTK